MKDFRRVLSLALIAVLLIGSVPLARGVSDVWDGSIATGFASGTGTEADPYIIKTAAQLAYLAASVNDGNRYKGKRFRLEADIVLNDTADWKNWGTTPPANDWVPIGWANRNILDNSKQGFSGVFDGNGHTVAGVYVGFCNYKGLFGVLQSGTVKNLGVVDSYIYCEGGYSAGVCGGNFKGTIENCYNTGTVDGSDNGASNNIGGVCGYSTGTITGCYNTGTVTGGSASIGGVCGYNSKEVDQGVITDCYNTGAISDGSNVGGVCGYSDGVIARCYNTAAVTGDTRNIGGVCGKDCGRIQDCYNTASVTGDVRVGGVCGSGGEVINCYNTGAVTGGGWTGGVVGYCEGGTIHHSHNTGTVTCNSGSVGGVCGSSSGWVLLSYNTGSVTGTANGVGGVCGDNQRVVENCYNTGAVNGVYYVGGVCGENNGSDKDDGITNCYNIGTVTGTREYIGGVCGGSGKVTNCYYLNTSCSSGNTRGTALTNAQMQSAKSFVGFDFNSIWTINSKNTAYPYPTFAVAFVDILTNAYYYAPVLWAVKKGITGGVDSLHFAPNAECTRAQAVMFLWNAAGKPKASAGTKNPFVDVKAGKYYYDAVLWAISKGITDGTDATHFSPNAKLNRATFVTFLWRVMGEAKVPATDKFADVKRGRFYSTAVAWAVANNLTEGKTETMFGPEDLCSRAQVVTFLQRAYDK